MGRFIKVLLNIGDNHVGYYPPEVDVVMQKQPFPLNRIGASVLAMERDGGMYVVPSAGFDMTDIKDRDGNALSVAGRDGYYYAYDAKNDETRVYRIVKVDTSIPWYIRQDMNGDEIHYFGRKDSYTVLHEDINYCIPRSEDKE